MNAVRQKKTAPAGQRLSEDDLRGYNDLTTWLVVSDGEGVQPFDSKAEAIESAKEQAKDTPNLVLGVYRLEHYVSARVQPAALFEPVRPSKP